MGGDHLGTYLMKVVLAIPFFLLIGRAEAQMIHYSAPMAVAPVTVTFADVSSYNSAATSSVRHAWGHTVTDHPNRYLVVMLRAVGTVDSVKFGTQAMTLIDQANGLTTVYTYGLKMPAVGADSIRHWSTTAGWGLGGACGYYNVNQTTPYTGVKDTTATDAVPGANVVCTSVYELAFFAVFITANRVIVPRVSSTERVDVAQTSDSDKLGMYEKTASAGTVEIGCTIAEVKPWVGCALRLNPP